MRGKERAGGLEEEQGDPERKTIPPSHSKGPNTDKGLWLSPEVVCGMEAAEACCLLLSESPRLCWGTSPCSYGKTEGQQGTPGPYHFPDWSGLELS